MRMRMMRESISKNSCSKNNIIATILYLPVIVIIINSIDLVFSRHLLISKMKRND